MYSKTYPESNSGSDTPTYCATCCCGTATDPSTNSICLHSPTNQPTNSRSYSKTYPRSNSGSDTPTYCGTCCYGTATDPSTNAIYLHSPTNQPTNSRTY